MKRWFYILLGGLGMSLTSGAIVAMIWLQAPGNTNPARVLICEGVLLVAGIAMGVMGFINGRNAGELDINGYMKAPRRDYGVDGHEIGFYCPACKKGYRASPLLAGKQFTCRDCQKVFSVTPSDKMPDNSGEATGETPGPVERRMLPAPG
jgi:hypothetical protein